MSKKYSFQNNRREKKRKRNFFFFTVSTFEFFEWTILQMALISINHGLSSSSNIKSHPMTANLPSFFDGRQCTSFDGIGFVWRPIE